MRTALCWAVTQSIFDSALEDGTERSSRNVGKELSLFAAESPEGHSSHLPKYVKNTNSATVYIIEQKCNKTHDS